MKSLRHAISFVALTALLIFAQIVSAAYPTNIRQQTMLGYNIDTQAWSRADVGAKTWFEDAWDTHHADRWANQPDAYSQHFAGVMFPFEWKQIYVDDSITPTTSQARDHTWSNYIWNNGGTDDPIGIAKLHARVIAGDAVVIPKIGFSATATPTPVPQFIRDVSSWWWIGGGTSTSPTVQHFIRYDNADVQDHVENVLYAMHQKWGNDPAVAGFIFGEYFNGPSEDHPSGFSAKNHKEGVKTILTNVLAAMPLDSDGKRQMLGLASPTFGGTFVRDDIIDMGLLPVSSNVELVFPPENYALMEDLKYYSDQGAHVLSKGDSRFYDLAKKFDWTDAPSNPNGYGSSDTAVVVDVEDYSWYHCDVVPTHSIFYNTGSGLTQSEINTAISKFGRGGSLASTWCVAPATYSASSAPGGSEISTAAIQTKTGTGSMVTSGSLTFDITPIVDNYALFMLSLNGPRSIVSGPTGFNLIHSTTSADTGAVMTQAWWWKRLDGTETGALSASWSSSTGYTATLIELPGTGLTLSSIGGSAEDDSGIASGGSSITSGSDAPTTSTATALAFFGFDDWSQNDGGKGYSDGYSEVLFRNDGVDASHALAIKELSSTASTSSTFSTSEGGDQMYGSLLIFEGSVVTPSLSSPTGAGTGKTTATGSVITGDTTGTIYQFTKRGDKTALGVVPATPSEADMIAGTGAVYSSSQTVTSATTYTFPITGLIAGVEYFNFFMYCNVTCESPVASSAFSTTAGTPGVTGILRDTDNAALFASQSFTYSARDAIHADDREDSGVFTTNSSGAFSIELGGLIEIEDTVVLTIEDDAETVRAVYRLTVEDLD
ncbi:MAG: hypothetical protein ACPGSM_21395 [Thiolinea sp.]